MKTRRFFWGNALPQALMAAARYHGLSPEQLDYRIYDKRHGFVTRTRRLIIEVDPAAPQRPPTGRSLHPAQPPQPPQPPRSAQPLRPAEPAPSERPRPSTPKPPPPPITPERPSAWSTPPIPSIAARLVNPATRQPQVAAEYRPAPRLPGAPAHASGHLEPFLPPDGESELAAAVAVGRLLALAGLELSVRVERQPDRLLIALEGLDEERLRELGEEFLDDLEHLVPRAIRGLAGRMVRCKVDGAGLRIAREDELKKLAEEAADHVAATREAMLLEPLSSADRRTVHLALVDDPRVTTESQGSGFEKRIRISPMDSPATAPTAN